jgi:hypothetical protein
MTDRCTRMADAAFNRRVLSSDLKTRIRYTQENARHVAALKRYPLFQDIPVSLQKKEKI